MMKGYLLDTNICIYLLKGRYNIAERLSSLDDVRVCISEITLAELYYGASKSERKKEQIRDVNIIADMFEVLPISDSLELYGDNRYLLEKQGLRIDDFDLLIGTTAIVNNLVVVTENIKHLGRIPQVQVENWIENS